MPTEYKTVLWAPAVIGGPPRKGFTGPLPSEKLSFAALEDTLVRHSEDGWRLTSSATVQSWGEPALLLIYSREGAPPSPVAELLDFVQNVAGNWCCETDGCSTDEPSCQVMEARALLLRIKAPAGVKIDDTL